MWLKDLAEEVHAQAILQLVAASFHWRTHPRCAARLVDDAADGLRTALPLLDVLAIEDAQN